MSQFSLEETVKLLSAKCEAAECTFNGRFLNVQLDESLIKLLEKFGIVYDIEDSKIDLGNPFNNNIFLYYNVEDFVARFKSQDLQSSSVFIIRSENGLITNLKDNINSATDIIGNYNSYKNALNFFLTATDFISYANLANQEFVLITDKVVHIGYNPLEQESVHLDGIQLNLERLRKSFENIEYQGFFKSTVVETIERVDKGKRFFEIIKNLPIYLDIADRDFQLYIRKFAFDKIKAKFKEERTKYFESIEKNLDNINKQITALPLTFSASAFASHQVKDKPLILCLIMIVYSLYTILAWKIINLSKSNLANVYLDMMTEARGIMKSYDVIYKDFKPEFKKILRRIKKVNSIITILKSSLILMIVLFIIFVLIQILAVSNSAETLKPKFI